MNRNFGAAAFVVGLLAVVWVGAGYAGSNPLALAMTVLIGAFYLMGALELRRFHQATSSLVVALGAVPDNLAVLGDWLARIHPSLQSPVRLRVEGERIGLPGPAMTPYLVGLLVLLGMLGTFLGMVVTLNGAVIALESTTDLATVRAALAAPVKGLGLAFGTSVAGVCASAMLGLVSALCRRERLQAAQLLDTGIATALRVFSLAHHRQEVFRASMSQARALPELVDGLQALMAQIERRGEALNERLFAGQESFHRQAQVAYTELAAAVGLSLKESLAEGARVAGATIQPVVEATMNGIAREATSLHEKTADTVRQSLDGLAVRIDTTAATMAESWHEALSRHERGTEHFTKDLRQSLQDFNGTFGQGAASLLASVDHSQGVLRNDLAASEQQRQAALGQSLAAMAAALQREWQQQGAQTLGQQERICLTLEQTARDINAQAKADSMGTLAELARLMQAASEAPRAAAEMMLVLREKLADGMARDNDLLDERARVMATLSGLLDVMQHAAAEQRGAIDTLVASSTDTLNQVGKRFAEKVQAESGQLTAVAAQITGSAVEVSSLGEAFGHAVQLFSDSNEALMASLQRMEAAMGKSTLRSDEQLAYYVAQAREVIDLSLSSQRQIIEDLRQIPGRHAPLAGEAA